jgi:ATP-dependent Clp protease ATP-binding subunit ClpX
LPIVATLSDMDEEAMMRILTEPRNAIIKQYQKFFEMEDVRLEFADEALRAVVKIASQRKTGARGLRAVLEDAMLNIMYDLPSRKDVEACIVHDGVILRGEAPELIMRERHKKEA